MKRKTKIIIGLTLASAAAATLAACNVWNTPYDNLQEDNYTVAVRYDANGGQFASTSDVYIVDVFSLEQAVEGVKLIEPGSNDRGESKGTSLASKSGYFLAGWYKNREPRKNENGEPLDENGELCSVSGKEQGYVYSDKWDFSQKLQVEEGDYNEKQEDGRKQPYLTLYAAWVPEFSFSFLAESDGKWQEVGSYKFTPDADVMFDPDKSSKDISVPYWEDEQEGITDEFKKNKFSGGMTYGNFPKIAGKTFSAVYADAEKSQKVTDSTISHLSYVDDKTGTAVNGTVQYYTEWLDGDWFHVYSIKQFTNNARITGCYELYTDLDFSGSSWSNGLATGDFTGQIIGNGHNISNIEATQSGYDKLNGGLFGRIMNGAVFKDVTFENVTYNLNAATRFKGGNFGLFSGYIFPEAKFENVNVTGTLHIGNIHEDYSNYDVGLLCANIQSFTASPVNYEVGLVIDPVKIGTTVSYPHNATVNSNGTVTFAKNEDPKSDPNPKTDGE